MHLFFFIFQAINLGKKYFAKHLNNLNSNPKNFKCIYFYEKINYKNYTRFLGSDYVINNFNLSEVE